MLIRTSAAQDSILHDWYRKIVQAHHDEGCDLPGFTLEIDLGLPAHYGTDIVAICGSARLELGQVDVSSE